MMTRQQIHDDIENIMIDLGAYNSNLIQDWATLVCEVLSQRQVRVINQFIDDIYNEKEIQ